MTEPRRPWRLVLDTNVVLDLLHFLDPASSSIRQVIESHSARCYASQSMLAELSRVLSYPEFHLDAAAQTALLTRYQSWTGEIQEAIKHRTLPRCRDPDDQMFLELAASVSADLLISKDNALLALKHHALGFTILTPAEAAGFFGAHPEGVTPVASLTRYPLRQEQIP